MRDRLAEALLAKVLEWDPEEVSLERPVVQALASYKYDDYQQFSAGSRFIESLALWLNQFRTADERRRAYAFIKRRLIFLSAAEIRHFVETAYPDFIRPALLDQVAVTSLDRYRPASLAAQTAFRIRQRQCLFLGLSDGARIDAFRRANPALNHEQIWLTHELPTERVTKLLDKLGEHLAKILGRSATQEEQLFRTVVLLDDFSASGTSYYGLPATAPSDGKVMGLFERVYSTLSQLFDLTQLRVFILLYMATEQAVTHLQRASEATWGRKGVECTVKVVQPIPASVRLMAGANEIGDLIEHTDYYDHSIYDPHIAKGGTADARYGYAACGLPLVLHHNTPNNSIALLMSYEECSFRGLFPRIRRHKEMS